MAGHHAVTGRLLPRQFTAEMWRAFAGRLGETSAPGAARRLARWQRAVAAQIGPASGLTAVHDVAGRPHFRLLGFELMPVLPALDGAPLVSIASGRRTGPLPVVVGAWTSRLDGLTRRAVHEGVARGARWAFCFNAREVRLVDCDRPYARRFLDVDLLGAARDPDEARLWWAALRADAFERRPRAPETLMAALVAAADAHAGRLADWLQIGVRDALDTLARALRHAESRRRTAPAAIVDQSLTIVYRLLFLLFAEARALVPMWNPIYRDSYSVDGLREACDQASAAGLWDALQAMSRLAHAGCATRDLRVTAFNSQLFSPERAPLVERARVDDDTMARVLRSLTDAPGGTRLAYADLGVEQLGAVYERLLDVTPDLEAALAGPVAAGAGPAATPPDGRTSRAARQPADRGGGSPLARMVARTGRPGSARAPSARRKESATFYTPRPMAEFLVRETLAPLVRGASCERILALRVLDPAMGSGAFLVAACRFLADACAEARARDGSAAVEADPSAERARLRRLVAQRCLFGVDLNPVAVQLARLSLWLATLAADAPLTFLDHHLCAGDSLVGASVDDLMRGWPEAPLAPEDRAAPRLFDACAVTDLMRGVMPLRARLAGPDDSASAVRDKERTLARSLTEGELSRWLALADLWCARWFAHGPGAAPPASAWRALGDRVLGAESPLPARLADPWTRAAADVARSHPFLHWGLRFPEVFFDGEGRPRPDGGFDAIVGNPPWDMVRADARDTALRRAGREASAALARFARESRLYRSGRDAHLNRYQLFVERALSLARPGGRLGLIVPWGLAGDVASAPLRRALFERCDTDTLIAFENSSGVFPIHRGVRFVLFAATAGRPTTRIACRMSVRTLDGLDGTAAGSSAGGGVAITPQWLRRVSGEGLELPYVRDAREVSLVDRLHARWPALGSRGGWGATFGRELNATDDRALFRPARAGAPVVDGRHVVPFALRLDPAGRVVPSALVEGLAQRVPSMLRSRLAYRDVAAATNRVTLIAAILPPRVISTHTLFCLKSPLELDAQYVLCALMNSLVANFLVRLRVTTHVTIATISRLPMPRPARGAAFDALAAWARALERVARTVPAGTRDRAAGLCEASPAWASLQALAARTYGLDAGEFSHVLSSFPLVDAGARRAAFDWFGRQPGRA